MSSADPSRYAHTLSDPLIAGISDLPVGSGDQEDAFGLHRQLAGFYHILRHPETSTPLSLAIYGKWGSGKSSAMGWLKQQLDAWTKHINTPEKATFRISAEQADTANAQRDGYPRIITVNFYPWKYKQPEELWRGILAEVILAILNDDTSDLGWWQEAKGSLGVISRALGKGLLDSAKVRAGLQVGSKEAASANARLDANPKDFYEAVRGEIQPEDKHLNLFEEELRKFVRLALSKRRRIVLFVDDLDRCEPDVAYQMLESVKLYLNIPGIVFVFGVDEDVLRGHIRKRYLDLGVDEREASDEPSPDVRHVAEALRAIAQRAIAQGSDAPEGEAVAENPAPSQRASVQKEARIAKADDYFKKLFGQELHLIPVQEGTQKFIVDLLRKGLATLLFNDPEGHEDKFRRVANVILLVSRGNPREAKRLVNMAIAGALGAVDGSHLGNCNPSKVWHGVGSALLRIYLIRGGHERLLGTYDLDRFLLSWRKLHEVELRPVLTGDILERIGELNEYDAAHLSGLCDQFVNNRIAPEVFKREVGSLFGGIRPSFIPLLTVWLRHFGSNGVDLIFENRVKGFLPLTSEEPVRRLAELLLVDELDDQLSVAAGSTQRANLPFVVDPNHAVWQAIARELGIDDPNELTRDLVATLESLTLSSKSITDITPLAQVVNLRSLSLLDTRVEDFEPLKCLRALRALDLAETPVSGLEFLQNIHTLEELYLTDLKAPNLAPLAGLNALVKLEIFGSSLEDIAALRGLAALNKVHLHGSPVKDISPLAELPALQTLYLDYTHVEDFNPLRRLSSIITLDLMGTQISDLEPLMALSQLTTLDLNDTQVGDLEPLRRLTGLKELYLDGTQVSQLWPLQEFFSLTRLELRGTPVQDITPLQGLTSLTTLYLSSTHVQDVTPLQGLPALTALGLGGTQVQDVTPLHGLTALGLLDLSDTQVQDVTPLQGLTALTTLSLMNTQVQDLTPLKGLSALTKLYLSGTPVPKEQVEWLRKQLPNCQIRF